MPATDVPDVERLRELNEQYVRASLAGDQWRVVSARVTRPRGDS
ncbi:MAG: hypothetical protein ACJ79S_09795 [Gemmatimonadaceae bacterium]